jgi:hypothetical protein
MWNFFVYNENCSKIDEKYSELQQSHGHELKNQYGCYWPWRIERK